MKETFVFNIIDYIKEINFFVSSASLILVFNKIVELFTTLSNTKFNVHLDFIFNLIANNTYIDEFHNNVYILTNILTLIGYFSGKLFFFFSTQWINFLSTFDRTFVFFFFGLLFFLSTCLSFVFISYLGLYGVFKLNIITLFLFWVSILFNFNNFVLDNTSMLIKIGRWFYIFHNYPINLEFFIDPLSLCYMVLTLTISYFVQLYTFAYFRYEPLVERLILFLNSFILSMIFFVSSANIILLFLGWELIGLTSFVLINFWVTRKGTLKAAFKAFVFNKISDIFFFIFIILILFGFNSIEIITIIKQSTTIEHVNVSILGCDFKLVELLCLFLMGAAFIKSAQLGFHLWLPDSMEAPVPASALIHSATLVSAGLFLLLRFNSIFELSNYVIFIVCIISALTSLYGGLGAMFQSDVKRILAYSTISHCGFLIVSFFFFSIDVTIFYLYVHGFFKAGVFLCVGNVIRFSNNYQDFRRMGGFYKYLPSDCCFIAIGLFNLGGLPFSIGFYMKHALLTIIQQNTIFNSFILTICIFGALTGLFYSYKLFDYVFFDFKKAKKYIYNRYNKILLWKQHDYYYINSKNAVFAIKYLFFFAYIISFWYFLIMKTMNLSLDLSLIANSNFFDLIIDNTNFMWNLTFLNWLIINLLIAVFYSLWRSNIYYVTIYNNFFSLVIFGFSVIFFF